MAEARGVLDTCAFIDFELLDQDRLPDVIELTSITIAELHQGLAYPLSLRERAERFERLNTAIARFDPLRFDGESASRYGTIVALTLDAGRSPKPRKMDLMIAAIASVHELPLYTRNVDDFKALESVVRIVEI